MRYTVTLKTVGPSLRKCMKGSFIRSFMVDLGNQYDGFERSWTPDGIERGKFCNYIYTRQMYKNVQTQVAVDR
jgi:hypothetical protein